LFFPPFVVRLRALMLTIADEHKAGMFRFDHPLSVNGRENQKGADRSRANLTPVKKLAVRRPVRPEIDKRAFGPIVSSNEPTAGD
jgi:hypothetical protein